jgi:hypothetical protein
MSCKEVSKLQQRIQEMQDRDEAYGLESFSKTYRPYINGFLLTVTVLHKKVFSSKLRRVKTNENTTTY